MTQVVLQHVKVERKVSARTNKPYIAASISVDGTWYNGFGNEEMMNWKAGDTKEVELFEEEYNGKMYKKFKVPSRLDLLIARVAELEARVSKLEGTGQNITAQDFVMPEDDLPF
tara:strand:+ start:292 stop:633 length:342 start_codon:yes stop_codon:yes gene_type:complete